MYEVTAVTEKPCPFCMDGRIKNGVVFEVRGPFTGICCAARLAVLVKQQSPSEEPSPNGNAQ